MAMIDWQSDADARFRSGLYDALANTTLHEWTVTAPPLIVPCDYSVYVNSTAGSVAITEDSVGVYGIFT